jgi:hypothetical protein
MSDNGNSKPNGVASPTPEAPAPKSLREIAEDAYDEVIEASDEPSGEGQEQPAVDAGGQQRDAQGRFVARQAAQPGEAEAGQQPPPSPENEPAKTQEQPTQPAQAVSSEPPANWSAEDRKTFLELPGPAQAFLLRRHSEMEGDYQRRVGQTRQATEFTNALAPIFNDPAIAGSMRENNLSAFDAIREWAGMHRRAVSPDMRDRAQLWHEMGVRMGLDPAAVYGQSRSGPEVQLSEQDLKDPAIKYFADHVSRTVQEVQALKGQLVAMQQAEVNRTNAEAMKVTQWGIDNFASEKGADGQPLRPDFDALLPQIIELFSANPNRDLREAYETARWMHPEVRARLIAAERTSVQKQIGNDRAKQANRLNARGVTSPVSKPAPEAGDKRSLRDVMETTADEIGFG